MDPEDFQITKIITLDDKLQHMTHYHEGYREYMLTRIYGSDKVSDELQIDVYRYSPGSARRISYESGWQEAMNDIKPTFIYQTTKLTLQ